MLRVASNITPDGLKWYSQYHNTLFDIGTADIIEQSIIKMPLGTSNGQRIGNCIVVERIEIHAEANLKPQQPLSNPFDPQITTAVLRLVPYLDTQPSLVADEPVITDIFDPNNGANINCYAFPNLDNEHRFMFLDDVAVTLKPNIMMNAIIIEGVTIDSTDRSTKPLFLEYETRIEARFDADGNVTSNNVGLMVMASNDDITSIRWYTRVFYRDA